MDRRHFITSMLGVAGAAATVSLLPSSAQASPLFDQLKAMDDAGTSPLKTAADAADLPAEGATEAQYYRRRYYRPRYARPYYRPRFRARCRTYVNRWGRLVRRCF